MIIIIISNTSISMITIVGSITTFVLLSLLLFIIIRIIVIAISSKALPSNEPKARPRDNNIITNAVRVLV